jgi:hypothetical protein
MLKKFFILLTFIGTIYPINAQGNIPIYSNDSEVIEAENENKIRVKRRDGGLATLRQGSPGMTTEELRAYRQLSEEKQRILSYNQNLINSFTWEKAKSQYIYLGIIYT